MTVRVTTDRLTARRELLDAVDDSRRNFDFHAATDTWSSHQKRAISLLSSSGTAAAFDVTSEPEKLRKRYGENHGYDDPVKCV